ncbi:MAG: hypothetical protein A2Y33_06170 [Spirochaetes bacterium GWF1_51_8]|nr:MAG: hypothetical protein A2Y33_06170 [Spirochaetes bacterium GWF1_51_8]
MKRIPVCIGFLFALSAAVSAKGPLPRNCDFPGHYAVTIDGLIPLSGGGFLFPGGLGVEGFALFSYAVGELWWEHYAEIGMYGAVYAGWIDLPGEFAWTFGFDLSGQWIDYIYAGFGSVLSNHPLSIGSGISATLFAVQRISPWMKFDYTAGAGLKSGDISLAGQPALDTWNIAGRVGWEFQWWKYVGIELRAEMNVGLRIFDAAERNYFTTQSMLFFGDFRFNLDNYNTRQIVLSAAAILSVRKRICPEEIFPASFVGRLPFAVRFSLMETGLFARAGFFLAEGSLFSLLADCGIQTAKMDDGIPDKYTEIADAALSAELKLAGVLLNARIGLIFYPVMIGEVSAGTTLFFD